MSTQGRLICLSLILLTSLCMACNQSSSSRPRVSSGIELPPPDSPKNVIDSIAIIYNDTEHTAAQRMVAYASLLPPETTGLPFLFMLEGGDIGQTPTSWNRTFELRAHQSLFEQHERGAVASVQLELTQAEPTPLEFPSPSQEDWLEVAVGNINLTVLFDPETGFRLSEGRVRVRLAPADVDLDGTDDRWYITEIREAQPVGARPGTESVESSTWADMKSYFARF